VIPAAHWAETTTVPAVGEVLRRDRLAIMSKEPSRVLPNLPTALVLGTDVQTYAWIDLPAQACDRGRLAVQQEINDAPAAAPMMSWWYGEATRRTIGRRFTALQDTSRSRQPWPRI
jgi:hypothetical protein